MLFGVVTTVVRSRGALWTVGAGTKLGEDESKAMLTLTRNARLFPAVSTSVPVSACEPAPGSLTATVADAPLIVAAAPIAMPSSFRLLIAESGSLATRLNEVSVEPAGSTSPSAGAELTRLGAVLSKR